MRQQEPHFPRADGDLYIATIAHLQVVVQMQRRPCPLHRKTARSLATQRRPTLLPILSAGEMPQQQFPIGVARYYDIQPTVARIAPWREMEIGPDVARVHHLEEKIAAGQIAPVEGNAQVRAWTVAQAFRQHLQRILDLGLGCRKVCECRMRIRFAHEAGKQTDPAPFQKVRDAPGPACSSDVERDAARVFPSGDLPFERYADHAERARDVVGRSHRYDGQRDVTPHHALRDPSDSSVPSSNRHQIGRLIQCGFPVLIAVRAVRDLISSASHQINHLVRTRLIIVAGLGIVYQSHSHILEPPRDAEPMAANRTQHL